MNEESREERYRRFVEGLKAGKDAGMIKVHITLEDEEVAGENLWATPIGKKYAKLCNIPFYSDDLSIDDIVEIEDVGGIQEVVRLISRGSYKTYIRYEVPEGIERAGLQAIFDRVCAHIRDAGGKIEGAIPGMAVIAMPTTMPFDEFKRVILATPHLTDACGLDEMTEDDYSIDIDELDLDLDLHEDDEEE